MRLLSFASLVLLGTVSNHATAREPFGYPPQGFEPRQDCVNDSTQKATVRIKITRNTLVGTDRNVRWVDEKPDEDEEDDTGKKIPQPKLDNVAYKTAFDVRMADRQMTTLMRAGDWAWVKISLGKKMEFYPQKALLIEDKQTSALCEMQDPAQYTTGGKAGNWYVKVKVEYRLANPITPYNVGILLVDETDSDIKTPVFVDPKIKNTG